MLKKYRGVVVPMVTPFTTSGKIDEAAVTRICQNFAKHGVSPLLLGTTGESTSVDSTDGQLLVKAAIKGIDRKVTVYAGLSSNCVKQNIENAKVYADLGVDVIVSILPCYYPLTSEQMQAYYEKLADSVAKPLMMYNIPATTHMSIPLEVVAKLSQHPNICGLKDSERDAERMETCVKTYKDREDFSYFLGYAALSSAALKLGADGIVPSTGNFTPAMFKQLYDYSLNEQWEEAERIQKETNEIAQIYQGGRTLGQSLPALKTMMSILGLCEPHTVSPLTTPTAEEQAQIVSATKEIMKKYTI
jgi:4-hydroxy-tetrahydrodipicolinate synthase